MARVATYVYGDDPVVEAGVAAQLRQMPGIEVLDESCVDRAVVAVVAIDQPSEEALRVVQALRGGDGPQVVLVVGRCDDDELVEAVASGITALLRRADATATQLAQAVQAASKGRGAVSPDLLGGLFSQVARLRRAAIGPEADASDLDDRERSVLRLVADGLDTREIAEHLAYSERTIKGIVQDVTRRLGARNRSHAVAAAVRLGLI